MGFSSSIFVREKGTQINYETATSVEDWCSDGIGIHDHLNLHNDDEKILGMKDVVDLLHFCWEQLQKIVGEPGVIKGGFRILSGTSEDFDNDDAPRITTTYLDGIEIGYEGDKYKRVYKEDSEVIVLPRDDWGYYGYVRGVECAITLLRTVDFNTQEVVYAGGY